MIWSGRYIKFIVGLNPTRLDSSVVRASGICPEGLGSIPSLVTFLYSNMLCVINLSRSDIELMPENGKSYYTLHYRILMHTYEVTLGITQIISTVDLLLDRSTRHSFSIDRGFVILKQLATGDDVDHMQMCFYTLQIRCKGAVNHIRQAFNSL